MLKLLKKLKIILRAKEAPDIPRAWYDRLSNFLLKNDFKRGQVDTTLFKKTLEKTF